MKRKFKRDKMTITTWLMTIGALLLSTVLVVAYCKYAVFIWNLFF